MSEFVWFDILIVVFITCKSSQAFIVNVDAPRIQRCDQHVNSYIEFETIDEQRIWYISAHDARLVDRHLRNVIDDEDALALAWIGGLDNPHILIDWVLWLGVLLLP